MPVGGNLQQVANGSDLEVQLPRSQTVARVARHALRAWCGERVDDELVLDAELLVSELATNALVHGEGQITLRARLDDDRLRVELMDEGTGFERDRRPHDFWQVGGWGLDIVAHVASRWGVHEAITHVWFELARCGPRFTEPRARRRAR